MEPGTLGLEGRDLTTAPTPPTCATETSEGILSLIGCFPILILFCLSWENTLCVPVGMKRATWGDYHPLERIITSLSLPWGITTSLSPPREDYHFSLLTGGIITPLRGLSSLSHYPGGLSPLSHFLGGLSPPREDYHLSLTTLGGVPSDRTRLPGGATLDR